MLACKETKEVGIASILPAPPQAHYSLHRPYAKYQKMNGRQ